MTHIQRYVTDQKALFIKTKEAQFGRTILIIG